MRENGLAELELEREEFRVRLRRDSATGRDRHKYALTFTCLRLLPRLLLHLHPLHRIPARRRRQQLLRIRTYTLFLHQLWARFTVRRLRLLTRL